MRRHLIVVIAGVGLALTAGAGVSLAQRVAPPIVVKPPVFVPITPPIVTTTPLTVPTSPPLTIPQTPNLSPAPLTPAPVVPLDRCNTTNPPAYCSTEQVQADWGNSCEQKCAASATTCLQTNSLTDTYFVSRQDGKLQMFRRSGRADVSTKQMNTCWDRLDACVANNQC
jgi:hypothetical protein